MPRPRLKDVARQAGVSTATVSRVVNERPGVSEAARLRVTDALRQLRWEPAGLRGSRRARAVGLLVPELTNPIFTAFAQGIETRLGRSQMMTMLCTSHPEGVTESDHVEELLDMGVTTLVFIAGSHCDTEAPDDHALFDELVRRSVPVITVNGLVPGIEGVASVICDDVEAGRLATEHLTRLGHRRIGLAAGDLRYVAAQARADGWRKALAERVMHSTAEVKWDPADTPLTASPLSEGGYTIRAGRRAGGTLLDQGVTGIVAASDLIALGVLQAARMRGLRIPNDLSIVGYDDSLLMPHMNPPLTTVRQPVGDMCRVIADLCVQSGRGQPLPTTEVVFQAELIARETTAPAPQLSQV
ncbi:LacI family DNA-binding transcriptional regulator [soil metagenome]